LIRYFYFSLRNIILFSITILIILVTLLTNKELVPFLAQKYAAKYGIKYSQIEGTLFSGIRVQGLSYKGFLSAKFFSINYDFLSLLHLSPRISKIKSDSLYINIDQIPSTDSNESSGFLNAFTIKELLLKNVEIKYNKEIYDFDINASKIDSQEALSVKKIALSFKSSYTNILLDGYISSNVLLADSTISINSSISEKYLDFLQMPPHNFKCKLKADIKNIKLSTELPTLKIKALQELEFHKIVVGLNYSIKHQKLSAGLSYKLNFNKYFLQAKQDIELSLDGNFSSNINAKVIDTPFVLPFKRINTKIAGNSKKIVISLDANRLHYKLKSDDYNNFSIKGEAKSLELSFIKELPELLQQDSISFKNTVNLQVSPFSLSSILKVDSLYYSLDTNATYKDGNISALYTLNPKRESALYKEFPVEKFSPLSGSYIFNGTDERAEIQANLLKMKLLKKGAKITGDGSLISNKFTFFINLKKVVPLELNLDMKVASLKKTLSALEFNNSSLNDISDIMLDANSTIVFSEPIIIKSSLYIPNITYKSDEQTTHLVKDISIKTSYTQNALTLEHYDLIYKTYFIYSNKNSQILLQNNSEVFFKEFWIFDNLLLSGVYKMQTQAGNFSLKSDNFHYKDENANVNVKIDLNASLDVNTTQVQGKVTLLDGNISYMPKSDYTISDPDIIIIQDIKKKKESQVLMDIKIDSNKDISYINKNINISLRPDIHLLKTAKKDTYIEGKVNISKGKVYLSDKAFIFDKSELYFTGSIPINPKLNLNLHYYTLDYIDIMIDVTNTLEQPVFIFSSNPVLSQNDIMSYILFGESSSSMFNSSRNSSKTSLLLGSGMKELFNTNSPIQLDTLNILTNQDGSLGYEIGSRVNKDMRIIYKNDTVSSVILQYNLSKSTRIDVDVYQAGQGVSFIYLRDFK